MALTPKKRKIVRMAGIGAAITGILTFIVFRYVGPLIDAPSFTTTESLGLAVMVVVTYFVVTTAIVGIGTEIREGGGANGHM